MVGFEMGDWASHGGATVAAVLLAGAAFAGVLALTRTQSPIMARVQG